MSISNRDAHHEHRITRFFGQNSMSETSHNVYDVTIPSSHMMKRMTNSVQSLQTSSHHEAACHRPFYETGFGAVVIFISTFALFSAVSASFCASFSERLGCKVWMAWPSDIGFDPVVVEPVVVDPVVVAVS